MMNNKHEDRQCPKCTIKHLGQAKVCAKKAMLLVGEAKVLWLETFRGYPHHYWDALAHMAQAEEEIAVIMPDETAAINAARKAWEADAKDVPDFDELRYMVNEGAMLGNPLETVGDRYAYLKDEQLKMKEDM